MRVLDQRSFLPALCNLILLAKSNVDNGAREFSVKVFFFFASFSFMDHTSQHKQRDCDLKTAQYFNIFRTLIFLEQIKIKNNDYGNKNDGTEKRIPLPCF